MLSPPRLLVALLLLLVASSHAKFQEFDDGDDVAEYDDNDFAEFEDTADEVTTERPPHQQHPLDEEEEDDEEATVELEGQEEFELDAEGQESDGDNEPYDDEEFEGYEDKMDSGSTIKNKDPITIVDQEEKEREATPPAVPEPTLPAPKPPSPVQQPVQLSFKSTEEKAFLDLEEDLDNMELDDIDTTDINLDDELSD